MDKILFVDDEQNIIKALKHLLFNGDYNCFYVTNGKDALKILEEYDIKFIVSDIRMPGMDGEELLHIVKDNYPKVIRIALGEESIRSQVNGIVESGLAKMALLKPWEDIELLSTLKKICALEEILHAKEISEFINKIESLPTVPAVFNKINEMLDQEAGVESIAEVIEKDQSIALKVLQIANSAYYSAKTGSIYQAMMYIGLVNVKNIVLAHSVFKTEDNVGIEKLWKHASITNKMAGYIYKKILFKKMPSEFSSAGLLHDIGRVIVMLYSEDENKKIDILLNKNIADLKKRLGYEKKLIGVDHQKIGAYLLNWWKIPLPIIEAALYHHDPLNEDIINKELVAVIYLSNILSWNLMGEDKTYINMEIDNKVIESLKIPLDKFYSKMEKFEI